MEEANYILPGYTRVTDIFFRLAGYDKIDPEVLKRAADRGTRVHQICEAITLDMGYPPITDDIEGYIHSFLHWVVDRDIITRPQRFYCDKHMITGECDGIYWDEGKHILFDLKTPAKESPTWLLQGSAYHYLANQKGYKIERIEFIRLRKDGKKAETYVYEPNFELFLKCLDVYNYFHKKPHPLSEMDI